MTLDDLWRFVANYVPPRVVYWCGIRLGSHATRGRFGATVAPDIMLTARPSELKALVPLLEKTVAGAVKGAHRARGGGK